MNGHSARRPRVVIIGGGMGGIAAAKTLANAPVEVTLVDSHNYYLFQPLLYEVAGDAYARSRSPSAHQRSQERDGAFIEPSGRNR
jgi:NADH dehydrogenase FAD-containing subunit